MFSDISVFLKSGSRSPLLLMASTSRPLSWSWPSRTDAARSSLAISTFSRSPLFFHEPIRRFTAARRRPRSSERDPPPSVEHKKLEIDVDLEFLTPAVGDKGSKTKDAAAVAEGAESSEPLSRRPRIRIQRDSFRRRPLWKRIVFASKKVRSIILLNVVTVIYASDIPVLKEVEQIVDPALFTVVRFALTAVPFLPFMLKDGDSKIQSDGRELGFWLSLGYLCQAFGLLTSEAGRASFLSAFTIVIVPFVDVFFGATVPALTWSGALLSLVGVAMLENGGSPCVGDLLNLLSAVFFGIHIIRTEQISRITKKSKFLALLGYEVFVVAFSSAVWFIFQKYFLDGDGLRLELCTWPILRDWIISFPWIPAIYTGIFSTGFCLLAEMDAMCDVSAIETAMIYGLEPVWGAAFAWFLLGERWGTSSWIGASLVICGSLTVQILGESSKDGSNLGLPNEQKDLSLSTVAVKPRKNDARLFRKKPIISNGRHPCESLVGLLTTGE